MNLKNNKKCLFIYDILSTYFNIINTTIGGGILGLPAMFHVCGYGIGFILLLLFTILTCYTYYALIKSSSSIEKKELINNNYISNLNVSKEFSNVYQIMLILYCLGICSIYINILGNLEYQIKDITSIPILYNRYFITLILIIFILFPICLFRNIKFLTIPSSFCFLLVLYILLILIIKCIDKFNKNEIIFDKFYLINYNNIINIFLLIPVIMLSFGSQFNVIPIYREQNNRDEKRMIYISIFSKFTCFILYFLFGFFGYIMFSNLNKIEGNILNNFPNDDYLILSTKICVYLIIIVSYPIIMFGLTENTLKFIEKDDYFFYILILIIYTIISFIFGNIIQNLIILINLCVTFCGGFGCFVFPIIIYYYYMKNDFEKHKKESKKTIDCYYLIYNIQRLFALIVILFFGILSTISFITGIISTVEYFKNK